MFHFLIVFLLAVHIPKGIELCLQADMHNSAAKTYVGMYECSWVSLFHLLELNVINKDDDDHSSHFNSELLVLCLC